MTPRPISSPRGDATDRDVCELAMYAGRVLLENGAELFRVEDTIRRINLAYGIESADAFVLSNGIFLTAGSGREETFARVRHIPIASSHLDKVAAVNQLSREIAAGKHTVKEATLALDRIRAMPQKKKGYQILASAIGSCAFCHLFGGGPTDMLTALIVGAVLWLALLYPLSKPQSGIVQNLLCGSLTAGLSVLLWKAGLGSDLSAIISGSIIPLIPGLAFTTAIRDLSNRDYISGLVRLLDALIIIFSVAMGVGVTISLLHKLMGGILL